MSILAKKKKIPVIDANQFNRIAQQNVTAKTEKDNADLAKGMDTSMVSESSMIIENADAAFAIVREFNKVDGKHYLGIKELKARSSTAGPTRNGVYFAHPFEPNNGMRLQEDYGLEKEEFSVDSIAGDTMQIEEVGNSENESMKGRGGRKKSDRTVKRKSLAEEYSD